MLNQTPLLWSGRSQARMALYGTLLLAMGLVVAACSGGGSATPPATRASSLTPTASAESLPDPSVRSDSPIGYLEFTVSDARNARVLPVSVWYPASHAGTRLARYAVIGKVTVPAKKVWTSVPVAPGKHPLIVFSHGNTGTRFQSTAITETLASHGFIVAALDHTGDTAGDSPTPAAQGRSTVQRPEDIRLLINDLLRRTADSTDPLDATIESNEIGMTGHSLGGYTTLAVAGGDGFGHRADNRVKAIAPLAPASILLPNDKLRAIHVPTLLIGASLDTSAPPAREVVRPYGIISASIRYRVVLTDGNHYSFTELCNPAGALSDPSVPSTLVRAAEALRTKDCGAHVMPYEEATSITNRYLVSFFRWQLMGDERYKRYLTAVPSVSFAGTK
jgi:predicted dienelactone hydrolase